MVKDYKRGLTDEQFESVLKTCFDKVDGVNDKDWQDIVDEFDLGIHRDVLRKAIQAPFSSYALQKHVEAKGFNDVEDNEILNKMEEKEMSIKEERYRLNDIRRRLNTQGRENGRYKNNLETLKESILELSTFKPMKVSKDLRIIGENEAVLIISDTHIGIKINNYFNQYSVGIAKERLERLVEKTVHKCKLHNVGKLHICVNGDLISGAIHKSLVADAEISLVESVTKGSELISETINALANSIENVEVYMAIGNHSRINPDKKNNLEKDSFEYLMFDFIRLRLANVSNINFNKNTYHDEIIDFSVFGNPILAIHGDKDHPKSVATKMMSFLGFKPYKIYLGHYHSYQSFDVNGTHVTVNGSTVSTDSYAFGLRLNSEPYQVLTIYDSVSKKEECEYKILLNN